MLLNLQLFPRAFLLTANENLFMSYWKHCCTNTQRLAKLKDDYLYLFHRLAEKFSIKLFKQPADRLISSDLFWLGQHHWFAFEFYRLIDYWVVSLKNVIGAAEFISELRRVQNELLQNTWLKRLNTKASVNDIDLQQLKLLRFPPKEFQIKALQKYLKIKMYTPYRGIILAFDQGLGKTYTSIMIVTAIKRTFNLIVCPNSLKLNWKEEILKFRKDADASQIFVVGIDSIRHFKANKDKIKWVIVNYESLHKVYPILDELRKYKRIALIADETQNIKNPDALRVKHLIEIVNRYNINHILLLSGTPIKGALKEFISYFRLIDPIFDELAEAIAKAYLANKKADELFLERLKLYMIRFTKAQVLKNELPPKHEIVEKCTLDPENAKKFKLSVEEIRKRFQELLDKYAEEYRLEWCRSKDKLIKEELPQLLTKAQKLGASDLYQTLKRLQDLIYSCIPMVLLNKSDCSHINRLPSIFGRSACMNRYRELKSELRALLLKYQQQLQLTKKQIESFLKLISFVFIPQMKVLGKAAGELISEITYNLAIAVPIICKDIVCKWIKKSTKTLIFVKSARAAKELKKVIENQCNVKALVVTGETEDKHQVVTEFKQSDKYKVLIATYATLGAGFTITEANVVLYWDLPWREADLRQAQDRIYRIGQDKEVYMVYIKLQYKGGTIQDTIESILSYYRDVQYGIDKPTDEGVSSPQNAKQAKLSLIKALLGNVARAAIKKI